jgi:xylulose-5-phosphate/fructose-6-phosphate phosphoketolase
VYSPDEASSNGLTGCLAAGLVIEVLAEDLCAAWTWGTVEAGKPAVMATYEAFAPLAATTIAQYAKMAQERPRQEAPPFLVLSTSLGWANTPTHQNTDLSGVLLARSQLRPDVVYPVGAGSAAYRFGRLMDERSDGVGMMVCSKQWLLDLPDSGSPATAYHVRGAGDPAAVLVVVCDVCATEAVAAAALAAGVGTAVEVIALVDLVRAPAALRGEAGRLSALPVLAAAWCAPRYVQPLVWEALGRPIPVQGYVERWAATPWETLQANRLDRGSLLEGLAAAGMPLPDGFLAAVAAELRGRLNAASDLSGVLPFDPPVLQVTAIGD